ncbi:hypothetical protein EGW08_022222 [Elysia chlorotica]|uniref:glutathione gamma-glutamylcysteinyltransferase n=1 Tax=Elysia chlorotica TaxID=188477 RepID=A0A3S1AXS3_ELYCH|nr:hypothetical protein EGW08_022222 [Elysia chlorotica]
MAATAGDQFYRMPLPQTGIDFSSSEGKAIFSEALASGHMQCFFKLIAQFRTQDEIAYCGITSLVMALNALEVDPGRIWKGPWRWYHESMLDCCTPLEIAQTKGINITQFMCLAKCNGLHAAAVSGSNIVSLSHLREEVKRVTQREDIVFIVSYSRKVLGQTGDGHFSPIAGYHEGRDLVLVLDTARFKYPPHWVKLEMLMDAMKTIDSETGKSRGYVMVSIAKDQITPLLFRPSCELSVDLKRGSLSPDILNFYRQWKRWLKTEVAGNSPGEDIIAQCTQHLLTMIEGGCFKKGPFCLAMPFKIKSGDETEIESLVINCEKLRLSAVKVIHALKSLFVEMESTKTFRRVQQFLSTRSKSDSELALQMVQCRSALPAVAGAACCQSECCQELGEHNKTACCGSHEPQTEDADSSSSDDAYECEHDCKTKCSFKFDCRPEHIISMFLFVWPHDDVLLGCGQSACQGSANSSNDACRKDKVSSEHGPPTEETPLVTMLKDLLLSDLENIRGTYFKGELKALMIKFHEVIKYHNQLE